MIQGALDGLQDTFFVLPRENNGGGNCVNLGLRPKKISQDVKHRWNFTYKMLKEACAYKMTLNQYRQLYLEHENIFISDDRWTLLEIIRDFLEVFHDATLFFSGVYYPTSNQALTHFYGISLTFKKREIFKFFNLCVYKWTQSFHNIG